MPRDSYKDKHTSKRSRRYSPDYRRGRQTPGANISDAETSQNEHSDEKLQVEKWGRIHEEPSDERSKLKSFGSQEDRNMKYSSRPRQKCRSQSFSNSLDQFEHELQRKKSFSKKIKQYQSGSGLKSKGQNSNKCRSTTSQIEYQAQNCLQEIQEFDFENLTYEELKHKFIRSCGNHIRFLNYLPEALNKIGQELIKNGLFHDMWYKAFSKNKGIQKESFIQSYFVRFRQKIEKGLSSFEKTFNPIPDDEDQDQKTQLNFKRYRNNYEENTNSTTKMDCMILFQQVKAQMKAQEIEQNLGRKVQQSIVQWKVKTAEEQLNLNVDPNLDLWFEDQKKINQNWDDQEEQQRRYLAIEKIKKSRQRERSPLSSRFRMMHECQTNERRIQVEMACVFLRLNKFYYLNDLQIVKIQETIFSQNQEIIVLKAYTVDFCPDMGMMKIEPKIKNLIAVYKTCGLSELIRLEKTYGAFDGVVVYPQTFDVQKYLSNNKDLSLLKKDFHEQVKNQIVESDDEPY